MSPYTINNGNRYLFLNRNPNEGIILLHEDYSSMQYKLEIKCVHIALALPKLTVSTVCHHCNAKHHILRSYTWRGNSDLGEVDVVKYEATLFPDFDKNLQGNSFEIVCGYRLGSPDEIRQLNDAVQSRNSDELVREPGLRILVNWSKSLNLTISEVTESEIYHANTPGKLKRFLQKLNTANKKNAIAIGYPPDLFSTHEIELTRAYTRNRISMLLRIQVMEINGIDVLVIIDQTFQLCIVLSGTLLVFLILIAVIIASRRATSDQQILTELRRTIFLLFEILYLQNSMLKLRCISIAAIRWQLYCWWVFSIIIITCHEATLTSKLVVPSIEPDIKFLSDLTSPRFKSWNWGSHTDISVVKSLFNGSKKYAGMIRNYEKYSLADCIWNVVNRPRFTCISYYSLLHVWTQVLLPKKYRESIVIRDSEFGDSVWTFALPKDSPWTNSVDRFTGTMTESGILGKWEEEHGRISKMKFQQMMKMAPGTLTSVRKSVKGDKKPGRILNFMAVVMRSGMVLYSIAICVFLFEIIWYHKCWIEKARWIREFVYKS
ncbi:unnamed protein product [Allacma fusca]|uniref:Ionotropic glutamate receptor C-terminal domain-containing protein n=1 Tax=Allacma fusca TaxID=39272 RepID=A0A8J2L1U2_9HEXA|nr:unnamed protein product [Allacma fusca]